MEHITDTFAGTGGLEIFWQAWLPEAEPEAVVVIAHGFGEHSGRYAHVAEHLVAEGYAVYAPDHRGHGRSQGRRAVLDSMDNTVADLRAFIATAAGRHPGKKVFLLGHSMGACISLAYATSHQDEIDGLALSGALAALDAASPVTRLAAKVLSRVAPNLGIVALDHTAISRDPEVVRAYEADPLVYDGKIPARTVGEFAVTVERFPEDVRRLRIPLLLMHGTADRLTPPAGSLMVYENAGSADKTHTPYEGLYHEILNEPEQGQVLDQLSGWLNART
jgi:acylglycerol lipase